MRVNRFRVLGYFLHKTLVEYGTIDYDCQNPGSQLLLQCLRDHIGDARPFSEVWKSYRRVPGRRGQSLRGLSSHGPLYKVCFPGAWGFPTSRPLHSLSFLVSLRDALKRKPIIPISRSMPRQQRPPHMNEWNIVVA